MTASRPGIRREGDRGPSGSCYSCYSLCLLCLLGVLQPGGKARAEEGRVRRGLRVVDLAGHCHHLDQPADRRALVLIFISVDCPIANGYQPELRRLSAAFGPQGFQFVLVHADPLVDRERARAHAREYAIADPVVCDPQQQLARSVGARVTPEVVVLDRLGRIRYRGRIDDRYVDFGKKRAVPTRADLSAALVQLDAGQAVSTPETKAIGCLIHYEEANRSE